MDQLSKTLEATRLRGSLLATLNCHAPWHVDFEQGFGAPTHYIVDGEAVLHRPEGPPLRLQAGDLVMFPRWDRHRMRSPDAAGPARTISDLVRADDKASWLPGEWLDEPLVVDIGSGGARTTILSLVFELDPNALHPLLLGLPRFIHVARDDAGMGLWLKPVLQFMALEAGERRKGYAAVSSRLIDLLFVQIVRSQLLLRPDQAEGWLRGLVDPAIGAVMGSLHDDPGHPWTLAAMAGVARQSRSSFCSRFQELTGMTPFAYLRTLRLDAAAARLEQGETVKTLTALSGYATAYAFSNAFKRRFGVPPGEYRRNALSVQQATR